MEKRKWTRRGEMNKRELILKIAREVRAKLDADAGPQAKCMEASKEIAARLREAGVNADLVYGGFYVDEPIEHDYDDFHCPSHLPARAAPRQAQARAGARGGSDSWATDAGCK